ncbi:hypothetical protein ABFY09_00015 [Marinomonas sp. 5E14-1]|uniref:hypothetical protein n=1 Tax=Marinomonas sp. 5E14-1 TaxID=3153922 RepID=UPI0032659E4D
MMIVDLIDEVDFIEKLRNVNVPVTEKMPISEVQLVLQNWLQDFPEQHSFVIELFKEITRTGVPILPEVRSVIDAITV